MDATRRMNRNPLSIQGDADESFDLPRGFSAEMNRKCNAFLEKRNLGPKKNYFGNFRSTFNKEGGSK